MSFIPIVIASGTVTVSGVAGSSALCRSGVSSLLSNSWMEAPNDLDFHSLRECGIDFTRTRFSLDTRKHKVVGFHYKNITPHTPYEVFSPFWTR